MAALSLAHRAWRALPQGPRRWALTHGAALVAPSPGSPPPAAHGLAVGGEVGRASGLGEGARLLLAGLAHLGVPHWTVPAGLGVADEGAQTVAVPPPGAPLLLHVNPPLLPLVMMRLPRVVRRHRRIIGHWAWELPVTPPAWRVGRRFVHEVWAPSRFTAQALTPLFERPVRVVPYPLAVSPPRPSALDRQAFGLPPGAVVTLVSFSLASSFERKNPLGAIRAHREAFGDRPDRLLLLKLAHVEHYAGDLARLREAVGGAGNIRLETRTLPGGDAHALTRACDMVLSLHRAEGFGLVPAEAMMLERPVVATDWSGNTDFMDSSGAAMVGCRLVPARDSRGVFEAPGASWADPDIGEAAAWLRLLADDPVRRETLGRAGRALAESRLGPEALAEAVRSLGLSCGAA